MPAATQLILDLENTPGALDLLARLLREAGVDVAGVCAIPCPRDGAFARPADPAAREHADAAARLAEAGINLICAYASGDGTRPVVVILNASDAARAAAALRRTEDPATGVDPGGDHRDLDPQVIRLIQQQLKAAGFDPGTNSGVLDAETRESLRAYQRAARLPPTGDLDEATRRLLLSISDWIRG